MNASRPWLTVKNLKLEKLKKIFISLISFFHSGILGYRDYLIRLSHLRFLVWNIKRKKSCITNQIYYIRDRPTSAWRKSTHNVIQKTASCARRIRERERKKRRKAIKHAKIKKKTRRFDSWKHKKSSISRHKKIVMYNVPKTISLTILLKEDYSRFTSRGRPTFCHTCARKW